MNIIDYLSLTISKQESPVPAEGSVSLDESAAMLYFKAAAVDTAISYVTNAIASCEIKTVENGEEVNGLLYYLLNVQPNPDYNASQLIDKAIRLLMTNGEALIVPMGDYLYVADGFAVDRQSIGRTTYRSVAVDGFNVTRDYPASEAIYLSFGNRRAKHLIDGMCEQYAQLMAAAASGYKAGSGTKWILDLGQSQSGSREHVKRDEEERSDPRTMLQRFLRASNAVYFQSRGQRLDKLDIKGSPSDDIIKFRKDAFELVASIYKIPQSMLFGNMTNMGEIVDTFLTFTVSPLAKQLEVELTSKLISKTNWKKGSRIVVDTSRIKFVDIFDSAPAISQLLGAGYSMDELRKMMRQPLIGTDEAQEHLITKNYGPLDEVLRQVLIGGDNQK